MREDYSPYGTAWDYFTHDQARSRAYRWGEDGIAGFCDDRQLLCLSLALWNGRDPILKERLFGLTNEEGNHGEDVKELYYYLDAVPSHAYARMLYKLPQAAYPYEWLIEENARRKGSAAMEFELIDTGIFDDDRYFDVEVEYAKADVGRHAHADHGRTTAVPTPRPSTSCRKPGSATSGAGRPGRRNRRCRTTAPASSRRITRSSGAYTHRIRSARIACCSATTKPISPVCSAPAERPATSRMHFTTTSSTAAPRR